MTGPQVKKATVATLAAAFPGSTFDVRTKAFTAKERGTLVVDATHYPVISYVDGPAYWTVRHAVGSHAVVKRRYSFSTQKATWPFQTTDESLRYLTSLDASDFRYLSEKEVAA